MFWSFANESDLWMDQQCAGVRNLLVLEGNYNLNDRFARDQVMHLETAANLWGSRRQENDFFAFCSVFELGRIKSHLVTGPAGNSEFVSPRPLSIEGLGETKLTIFPWDQSLITKERIVNRMM